MHRLAYSPISLGQTALCAGFARNWRTEGYVLRIYTTKKRTDQSSGRLRRNMSYDTFKFHIGQVLSDRVQDASVYPKCTFVLLIKDVLDILSCGKTSFSGTLNSLCVLSQR